MRRAGPSQPMLDAVAASMRRVAATGETDGHLAASWPYLRRCRRMAFGTLLIFTRDTAMHTSGWLKNPDYERCLHLSLSPAPRELWTPDTPDLDRKLVAGWLLAFFRDDARLALAESPKSPAGKAANVWHWRVFCDERWNPIHPRGEVYSKAWTPADWRSASELGIEIESALGRDP